MSRCLTTLAIAFASSHALSADVRILDQNGEPVENAVVLIESDRLSGDVSQAVVLVEQRQQQFVPRVTVVPKNSTIQFPNRDRTLHHVYSFSEAKQFELELIADVDAQRVVFESNGIVAIGCNIHDWMLGYIVVTDAARYGVSDRDGNVNTAHLDDIPVKVTIWHPAIKDQVAVEVPKQPLQASYSINLGPNDPLDFELDPLQDLFSKQ